MEPEACVFCGQLQRSTLERQLDLVLGQAIVEPHFPPWRSFSEELLVDIPDRN